MPRDEEVDVTKTLGFRLDAREAPVRRTYTRLTRHFREGVQRAGDEESERVPRRMPRVLTVTKCDVPWATYPAEVFSR